MTRAIIKGGAIKCMLIFLAGFFSIYGQRYDIYKAFINEHTTYIIQTTDFLLESAITDMNNKQFNQNVTD